MQLGGANDHGVGCCADGRRDVRHSGRGAGKEADGSRGDSGDSRTRWRAMEDGDRRHVRSEEHTSELQSPCNLVCRLLLEKKKKVTTTPRAKHENRAICNN